MAVLRNPYVGDDPPDDALEPEPPDPVCPECGRPWEPEQTQCPRCGFGDAPDTKREGTS